MSYRDSNLGLLIKLAPRQAADKITQAFADFNRFDQGDPGRTIELVAARLDCSASSLKRHLRVLEDAGIPVVYAAKGTPVPRAPLPPVAKRPVAKKKAPPKRAAKTPVRKKRTAV